jgi:Spy/CpxP family protein refolding chaperone
MKGIRMAALGAALVLGMSATVFAQDAVARGGGQGRGGGRGGIGMLMTDITVTPEVQTKIQEIVTRYQAQTREIMMAAVQAAGGAADASAAGGARGGRGMLDAESQKKVDELNAKRNAEIGALLTAEQKVQFEKNLATVAAGRRGGGGGGGARGNAPPPPPPPPVR